MTDTTATGWDRNQMAARAAKELDSRGYVTYTFDVADAAEGEVR